MIESLALIAVSVLLLLTVGSFLPFVPSGILSVVTVLVYWWQTGYSEPSILIVISLVLLGLTVTVTDFASGAVAGKLGGASNVSVLIGTIVGFVLLFIIGPIGFVLGIGVVVFLFSIYQENDTLGVAVKKSTYTVVGVLASKVVQVLLLLTLTGVFAFFTIL
jgi:hypothetical protein